MILWRLTVAIRGSVTISIHILLVSWQYVGLPLNKTCIGVILSIVVRHIADVR